MCKFEHYIQALMFLQSCVYLNKSSFSKYNINLNQLDFFGFFFLQVIIF